MAHPVLLIEDDDDIRMLAEMSLRLAGIEVIACSEGRDGLAALAKTKFSLVLLDVMMPDMSGYEVLEQIAEKFGRQAPPVALFTARPQDATLRDVAGGMSVQILAKPFEPTALAESVKKMMKTEIGGSDA
jgi:two-component system, OmpR family, response regulator